MVKGKATSYDYEHSHSHGIAIGTASSDSPSSASEVCLHCRFDHQSEHIQFHRNTCVQATSLTMLVPYHSFLDIPIGDCQTRRSTGPRRPREACVYKIRLVLQLFKLQTLAKHYISEIPVLHNCQHKETTIFTVHHA